MNFFSKLSNQSPSVETLQKACENQEHHDFSFPTIYCYKDYPKLIAKNLIFIEENGIAIVASPSRRDFYFFKAPSKDQLTEKLSQAFKCTAIEKLENISGATKRTETVYNLSEVFNPAAYPNAKKRYQRITYPSTFLEKEKIIIRQLSSHKETIQAVELHEQWILDKINDPTIHQHSLSTARYRRCTILSEDIPESFRRYGVWDKDEKLIAVRIIGIQKKRAFDLAFYSDYKNMKSQMTEYINVSIMKLLYDEGFETLNSGLSAEKGLKQFKEHYPHKTLFSYQYKP